MHYCSTCGQHHADVTGACHTPFGVLTTPSEKSVQVPTPTQYHFPARTVSSDEALETCPFCEGHGYVGWSVKTKLEQALSAIRDLFRA